MRKDKWELVNMTILNKPGADNLRRYTHNMMARKGYRRVDKLRPGLYYTADDNKFTWYEWKAPGGLFTKMRLGFWTLYFQAIEEDSAREVWADA